MTKCWLCHNRYPGRLIKHTVITWTPKDRMIGEYLDEYTERHMERWMMFCQVCWGFW